MKITTAPKSQSVTRIPTVTINRLESVEEELVDRIAREKNGTMICGFCVKLSTMIKNSYAENSSELTQLREKLCSKLMDSLHCSTQQALGIVELATDLAHAKLHGKYRRSHADLGLLIATATGTIGEMGSN